MNGGSPIIQLSREIERRRARLASAQAEAGAYLKIVKC